VNGHIFWAAAFSRYLNRSVPRLTDANLAQELRKISVYQCPVFPNEKSPLDYVCNGWDKYSMSGATQAVFKITKFKRSSEVIFATEANANLPVDVFDTHDVWLPAHLPSGPKSERRILDDRRHRGAVNAVYLDGHTAGKPFKDLTDRDFRILTGAPGLY
jgi:prepilin-type processing-associated H-X9-DG protein